MESFHISFTLTDLLATWGTLSGTAGLVIALFSYLRDRAKVVIKVTKDWNVIGSPIHDRNKLYINVNVANKGRRPVTISKVGFVFLKRVGGAILADSMRNGPQTLQEGRSADFTLDQKETDFSEINYFTAYDAVGNVYKKGHAHFPRRFLYWFLHLSRINESLKQLAKISRSSLR